MPKLHELLAVETNLRSQAEATRKDLMNTFEKKRTHFSEIVVTFTPKEEGASPVEESKLGLQTTVRKELDWIGEKIAAAVDVGYQIDLANTTARQDVVLDNGTVLLKAVPATALLQMEKRLREVQELVTAIPTLDPTKGFTVDTHRGADVFKARDVLKARTKKVEDFQVVVQPTKEHPAQVAKLTKDVDTGELRQSEWSSLVTVSAKGDMLDRIEELLRAVKSARSRANDQVIEVAGNTIGTKLLDYAFWGKS